MRLYKIEITKKPELISEEHGDDDVYYSTLHLADPALREEWENSGITTKDSHFHFFLPSESKLYRSRSSAGDKQRIVERWGGKARILEAEVSEFIPIQEANKQRKNERDQERIRKLRNKINDIQAGMFFNDFTSALKAANDDRQAKL